MNDNPTTTETDEPVKFDSLGLRDSVLRGAMDAGFETPTDIQAQLIPAAIEGYDALGQAKTGTGKTAAFALPILHNADRSVQMQALILVPTRELATQVAKEIMVLGKHTPIRATCIIGGESMRRQSESVKRDGHIVVGTPGRVMDMHRRREIHFDNIRTVVLDEVDRMLDIGFREDIRQILKQIRQDHQTIFVSATIGEEIERLARTYMKKDAKKIVTFSGSLTVARVEQQYISVQPWDKRRLLLHLLRHEKPATTLVFCRTKISVDKVGRYLRDKGINAREIHGDLAQSRRNQVMESMRQGKLDVLIASDLAARGLDIEHISHVINYDLPDDPDVYVHRIGRTARAGRRGIAWSFVCPDQGQLLTEIEKLAGVLIEPKAYPDFRPGSIPEDVRSQMPKPISTDPTTPADSVSSRAVGTATDQLDEQQIAQMFPGGVIPKQRPSKTLGSRFRTRRSR